MAYFVTFSDSANALFVGTLSMLTANSSAFFPANFV